MKYIRKLCGGPRVRSHDPLRERLLIKPLGYYIHYLNSLVALNYILQRAMFLLPLCGNNIPSPLITTGGQRAAV